MESDEPASAPARPRAVLFDAGLTLIHASGKLLLDELTAAGVDTTGLTATRATQALVLAAEARHLPLPARPDGTELDGTEKVAAGMVRFLGIEHPAATAACLRGLARDDLYQDLDPDAVATLTALRDAGLRLGVVSNSAGTVRDDLAAFDLLRFFDVVVDSTVVGAEKPRPRPFRVALRELGLAGEACWYVGDGLFNDVLGARAAGYARGILLDRFGNYTAVPGIARITRLTELIDLIDRTVPTAGTGAAAADAGEADRLAGIAVRAVSTLWDPLARLSTPMWRRTERLARDVLDGLERAAATAGTPPVPVAPALAALRTAPLDRGGRAGVRAAVRHLLTSHPPAIGDLREPLTTFEWRNRVRQRLGTRYDPSGGQAPVTATQLAAACRPVALPMRDRWELTVVVDVRDTEPGLRLRNTVASLAALHDQSLRREAYRIVLVEQDGVPRHRELLSPLADRYVHAAHAGPYNRSWAHNVGAVATGKAERYLCFLDADVLPDRDFLAVTHRYLRDSGARALLPHASLLYVDAPSSDIAVRQRLLDGGAGVDIDECHGYQLLTNRGGCLFVESALFHAAGGYDERYEGWGDEDNEFYERLAELTPIAHLAFDLVHLHHPRPVMDNGGRRPNEWLLGLREGRPTTIGDPNRYAPRT